MKVDFITLIIFADCLKKRYHLTPIRISLHMFKIVVGRSESSDP